MTESWASSGVATFRCDLVVDGVPVSAYRQADRLLLRKHPEVRDRIERDLRFAMAQEIVKKLAPEVVEVSSCGTEVEQRISRPEALRLAQSHARALAKLASRLEQAGENYALRDVRQARDAVQALVDTLEGDEGRLPTDPRFWSSRTR